MPGSGGSETCLWSPRLTEALPWGTVPPRRMDSPGKLTGETLIVHHIPLVHCQVPDRPCCPDGQRTNPFSQADLGVARAPSHPERDLLQADSLLYDRCLQQLASEVAPAEAPGGQEVKARDPVAPTVLRRQNPFLLSNCEDHSPPGQESSFHLHHTKPAFHLHDRTQPFFRLHDGDPAVKPWMATCRLDVAEGQEDGLANDDLLPARSRLAPESMELDEYSCPLRGEAAPFSFEEDWANDSDELMPAPEAGRGRTCSCSHSELPRCRCHSLSSQSEPPDHPMGEASDSSCTSSDGVLVNFSALYQKMSGRPHPNLNSGQRSCSGGGGDIDSSSGSPSDSGGAFYLDLHSSPRDSAMSCESHEPEGPGEACGCRHPHHPPSSPVLDANCNSCLPLCDPCASEGAELTACLQSQARLVVATQNYYKLVTCDLSSQSSSPSPAGSSITSCSEDLARSSPLLQPTAYYLFQRPLPEESQAEGSGSREESQEEAKQSALQGQLYVNTSPPMLAGGRPRSRSYDRNLDRSPTARLGSLERMLSCPVKLSETPGGVAAAAAAAAESSSPKRVTSFAELAKGRKKNGSSPPLRASRDASLEFLPLPEQQKEDPAERHSHSLPPLALDLSLENYPDPKRGGPTPWKGQGPREVPTHGQEVSEHLFSPGTTEAGARAVSLLGQKDFRARADGGAPDGKVVRYSKDQRPTSLPIQPFVFQHHFPRQPKAPRALHSHLAASLSQLYSRSAARTGSHPATSASQPSTSAMASARQPRATVVGVLGHGQHSADNGGVTLGDLGTRRPIPETTRPSPLGSYSPVRSQAPFLPCVGDSSSGSPTPESHPPRSRSCPISANLLPASRPSPALGSHVPSVVAHVDTLQHLTPVSGKEGPKAKVPPATSLPPLLLGGQSLVSTGGRPEPQWKVSCNQEALGMGALSTAMLRPLKANHLSPQALKWREYRRRNPLGLDRVAGLTGSLDWKPHEGHVGGLLWKSPVFEFPAAWNAGRAANGRLNGPAGRLPQLHYADFFPDYFSLAEKPPAEFCLSPDGNTESISIDLLPKKSLVKAINMAVDLIVAHFGTSRDPGVKAKLGNSSVSPNVGHLALKYLCPAIRDLLSDGLKGFVLDVIVGQRRNMPWSIVEASTQLGPSTKVLHALYKKVSQCPELTSHTMRFNAFVFGLLNIRSLEFWFNHLYHHEDLVQVHYQPVGFLPLAHGPCQGLFEELLLLLQPLSLLPFDLDLLFEHRLRQMGHEQRQRKERLRVKQDLALSTHSTLQLMRTHGSGGGDGWWAAGQDPGGHALDGPAGEGDGGSRAKGVAAASGGREGGAGGDNQEQPKAPQGSPEPKKDKQASWWYQLMRSSQVYIEGSSKGPRLVRYEPRRKVVWPKTGGPPPREGVVEGAEACPITEGPPAQDQDQPPREPEEKLTPRDPPQKEEPPAREGAKEKVRPFWMGSPPHSVLAELKCAAEESGSDGSLEGGGASGGLEGSLPKWGHLFGSRKAPRDPRHTNNRLPSGWLSLDRSVLQLVVQTVGAGMWREATSQTEKKLVPGLPASSLEQPLPLQPTGQSTVTRETPSEVKALCHHIATERGQLSFKKGDVLRLLGRVDADWLRCARGAESGLVPTMYVTHTEDEDY